MQWVWPRAALLPAPPDRRRDYIATLKAVADPNLRYVQALSEGGDEPCAAAGCGPAADAPTLPSAPSPTAQGSPANTWGWLQGLLRRPGLVGVRPSRLRYLELLRQTRLVALLTDTAAERRAEAAAAVVAAAACVAVETRRTVAAPYEVAVAAALVAAAAAALAEDCRAWTLPAEVGASAAVAAEWEAFLVSSCGARENHGVAWAERATCLRAAVGIATGRLAEYYAGTLQNYEYPADTHTDIVLRGFDGAVAVASAVAPFFSRWQSALKLVGQMGMLRKLGPFMIGYVSLSSDVGEALADLAALMGCKELAGYTIPPKELAVGLYYLLVYRRGERGNHPRLALSEHVRPAAGVVDEDAPAALLERLAKFASVAKFIYQPTPADVGRLLSLYGYTLVHYEALHPARHPPFGIVVREEEKLALLVVRGTKHVSDVLIDVCANAAVLTLGGVDYQVHRGMLRSASWVLMKAYLAVCSLRSRGYKLVVVGHSLGAGIGVLLTAILRASLIPDLRCVAFAMPSCADRAFCELAEGFTLTGINGDDLVPRVRVESLRCLMAALSDPVLQEHSSQDLSGDATAIVSRLATIWSPRVRPPSGTGVGGDGAPPSPLRSLVAAAGPQHRYVRALERVMATRQLAVTVLYHTGASAAITVVRAAPLSVLRSFVAAQFGLPSSSAVKLFRRSEGGTFALLDNFDASVNAGFGLGSFEVPKAPVVLYAIDTQAAACGGGGDGEDILDLRFEDPGKAPVFVGLMQIDFRRATLSSVAAALASLAGRTDARLMELWRVDGEGCAQHLATGGSATLAALGLRSGDTLLGRDSWGARLAGKAKGRATEDSDTPEFWPPGVVVHMYQVCGVARAAVLRPWAAALERIEISSKMGDDHRMDAFIRTLRAVKLCKRNAQEVPYWEPYSKAAQCRCCRAEFSWCATSDSAAARLRSQAHCHHCGRVVCLECRRNTLASQRSPHPSPICDTCFFDL
eukprot:Rhum_TRINITY_DN2326_c1_g1::Rhum_TRINITY_DN2326_c1_g1_i1::g.6934::m.6934